MKSDSLRRIQKLVYVLADGQFHSGEYLAKHIGVSRTAIWKLVAKLETWQIKVFALRGKGYKIPGGLNLIDSEYLNQKVLAESNLFKHIDVLPTVDSTSSYMTRCWQQTPGDGRICVSEHQTQGRGRKGRKWISPFGANFYFSLGLNLPLGLSALGGLSLAVGIGLTKLLNEYTTEKIRLKWPNDILVDNRKLAGILVEASGDSNDNSFLNIGIGVNWDMPDGQTEIEQPWANLKSLLSKDIERSKILALMLLEIDRILCIYIEHGFDLFREQWPALSAYYKQPIAILTRSGKVAGKEIGIDKSGAIRIQTEEGERSFFSGEVSLRLESGV